LREREREREEAKRIKERERERRVVGRKIRERGGPLRVYIFVWLGCMCVLWVLGIVGCNGPY
jgi:hypothetical protein